MDFKIDSKKENPAFDRLEVSASISGFQTTPSRKEVTDLLCAELKCAPDVVVVQKVHQRFGTRQAFVSANMYKSAQAAAKTEPGYLFKRSAEKARGEEAEKPKQQKQQKKEEKKEAVKENG